MLSKKPLKGLIWTASSKLLMNLIHSCRRSVKRCKASSSSKDRQPDLLMRKQSLTSKKPKLKSSTTKRRNKLLSITSSPSGEEVFLCAVIATYSHLYEKSSISGY